MPKVTVNMHFLACTRLAGLDEVENLGWMSKPTKHG